jgi:hypothetical protein
LAPGLLALMALLLFPIPAPQQPTPHADVTPNPAPAAGTMMLDSGRADRVAQLTDTPLPMVSGARRSDLFPDVELTDQHGEYTPVSNRSGA